MSLEETMSHGDSHLFSKQTPLPLATTQTSQLVITLLLLVAQTPYTTVKQAICIRQEWECT